MDGFNDYLEEDLELEVQDPTQLENDLDNIPAIDVADDIFMEVEKTPTSAQESVLDALLKSKGIIDSKIIMTDESGEEQELNFYDLSQQEQLEILSQQTETSDTDLDESEINLINHLRTQNLSVDEFLDQYRNAILAEANQTTEVTYEIDAYDNEELFLFDLKQKYDLTDEELAAELEKELGNPDVFNKKVTKLRAEYKQLEDDYNAAKAAEFESQRQEQYNQFSSMMAEIANETTDYHGVYLEDNEKNETLSYILQLDATGVSQFSKDLNDPKKLYEAAWYLRYGAEAFKALEDAYEAEISKLKKTDKPRVVVQDSKEKIKSIYDLT